MLFTSPVTSGLQNYSTIAFETDLPGLESATAQDNPPFCDLNTGANCVDPPNGAAFYPFFTTGIHDGLCTWQEGGNHIPGTINHFDGGPNAEYGGVLHEVFPVPPFGTTVDPIQDFNSADRSNPCPVRFFFR